MPSSGMWLQAPVHAGSSLADFSTLKMDAIHSSETSVHTKFTRPHTPEDGIIHSHRSENLKPCIINHLISFHYLLNSGYETGRIGTPRPNLFCCSVCILCLSCLCLTTIGETQTHRQQGDLISIL
jgi:hypothetical protein